MARHFNENPHVHENSLNHLINEHYSEGKSIYEQLLADMRYAFLGESSTVQRSQSTLNLPEKDEL